MTNEQPEQWAVELADAFLATFDCSATSERCEAAALTIQRAFAEREAELVGENAKLREVNMRLRNGYADAVSGLVYIIQEHGRLSGVGFDRVLDHFFEWVTMPEREGLQAGSHTLAALKSREAGHG